MWTLLDPRAWALLGILLAGAYFGGRFHQGYADHKEYKAAQDRRNLAAQQQLNDAVAAARKEEQRRITEQTRIAEDATKQAEAARADARTADNVAGRLRQRISDLLAQRPAGNTVATSCSAPADDDRLTLLAELFRRADERAGTLAQDVDAARIAGTACQSAYDALTLQK